MNRRVRRAVAALLGRTGKESSGEGDPAAGEETQAPPRDLSPFEQLMKRHDAFFDVEWYSLQTGVQFEGANAAHAHASEHLDQSGFSPHPLYSVIWGRGYENKTRLSHSASYRRLFNAGWIEQNPHPIIDLAHIAKTHPESLGDEDGVFGWLLKRLAEGDRVRTTADQDSGLDWPKFRRSQFESLRAQRTLAARMPRWKARRETRKFDYEAEQALIDSIVQMPAPSSVSGPLVSVVMPAYNRAEAIRRAIHSVQSQSMADWELIVVNDGSTDGTRRVAQSYAADDDRIAVLDREHRGVSAARNTALRHARGRWIAFLDTDNTWSPHYLEVMTKALSAAGVRHGYGAQRIEDEEGISYRAMMQSDMLDVGNHIDLNVWMATRDVLATIGGFDEGLRRAVDYDLIWRVSDLETPHYVPFVAGTYSRLSSGADRITDTESFYWKDVVRSKNYVKWDRLAPSRPAGISAIVVWKGEPMRDLVRTVRQLGLPSSGTDEVVVVGTAGHKHGSLLIEAEATLSGKVRQVVAPPQSHTPLLANVGFAETTRTRILFLRPGTEIPRAGVHELAEAIDDGAGVAQPVILDGRGVVVHAGFRALDRDVSYARPLLPSKFLEDHLPEDLEALPERINSDGASIAALMTSAEIFTQLRGFDPLYGNFWFDTDYALRARSSGHRPIVTCTRVHATGIEGPDWTVPVATAAGAHLLERHGAVSSASDDPWQFMRLHVDGLRFLEPTFKGNAFLVPPSPSLRRSVFDEELSHSRRIAIKHCAPPGDRGLLWGDTYFAHDLARAFARAGHDVRVDNRESIARRSAALDELNVVVRGVRAVHPVPGALNVLWIISHPDRVQPHELVGFDLIYAASVTWAETASARFGREVKPLLQATEPRRFYPRPPDERKGPEVLFVGNRRSEYQRPVGVGMALAAGEFDVGIYGGGWSQDAMPASVVRGEFVPNEELPQYYSGAKVVMNDHFPTMHAAGIINNRIFDALACGTPVLTDEVPGAREVLGDRVLWYDSHTDIPDVLRRYFAAPWAEEDRAKIVEWTHANHSFDARVTEILADVAELDTTKSSGR